MTNKIDLIHLKEELDLWVKDLNLKFNTLQSDCRDIFTNQSEINDSNHKMITLLKHELLNLKKEVLTLKLAHLLKR